MVDSGSGLDNATALRLKLQLADEFRTQITLGFQTNSDEAGLRKLAIHYGFMDEDLDFIVNYDIKYRIGRGVEGEYTVQCAALVRHKYLNYISFS